MSTILDEIVAHKKREVTDRKRQTPQSELLAAIAAAGPPRAFARKLGEAAAERPAIIAEIKRGSPSLGEIRPDLIAERQAEAYEIGMASALSVLTDEHFFFGCDDDFRAARQQSTLPMLRKEFIIDDYQLYESRSLGADCVLLIMAILSDEEASRFTKLAHELGMDVLAETHNTEEIERAIAHVDYDLIGINNRNLKTFTTNVATTLELATLLPDRNRLVAESGLHTPAAIAELWEAGVSKFLVGEAFVRSNDPSQTVSSFVRMSSAPTAAL